MLSPKVRNLQLDLSRLQPVAATRPFLMRFDARWTVAAFLSFLFSSLLSPAGITGQDTDTISVPSAAEAEQALSEARNAQKDFESLRRKNLPINSLWGSAECSATVGRMCWRYHAALDWHPEVEDPKLTEARDSLLMVLGEAAQTAPEDPWILGQRVRYLLEAGKYEEARGLAWGCGGAPSWWCEALEGLVLHIQGRYPEAERAFDQALQEMEPEEAVAWKDLTPILDGDIRSLLGGDSESEPGERATMEARIWKLADPLYLVPGNDRRSEHLARQALNRIYSDSATPHRASWGADMGELQLRYGWELGWERIPPRPGEYSPVAIVGYEHPDLRSFLPPKEVLIAPATPRQEPWVPSMSPYIRSGYAPAYAPGFLPMTSRVMVFTRGAQSLVAATFQLPSDTTLRTLVGMRTPHMPPSAFRGLPLRAGFLLHQDDDTPLRASLGNGRTAGVLVLEVPAGDYLASVEVLDPAVGRAGRYRNGLRVLHRPLDLPVLSDLLLVDGNSLPGTTLEALEGLRIHNRITAGDPLVVGWELWGLGWREEVVGYRLTLESTDTGILERLSGLFRQEGRFPILEWEEPAPQEPGPAFQAVSITVPALEPGEYRLHLEVTLRGREALENSQTVRVLEPGGGRQEAPQ